jgi:hypothetical protein
VRATQHLIVHDPLRHVAEEELVTVTRDDAVHDAGVAAAATAAPARRRERQFVRPVGDREEPGGTGKDVEQEVSRKSERVDLDVVVVHEAGQGVHLGDTRELDLVDHQDPHSLVQELAHVRTQVALGGDGLGLGFDADPARHHAVGAAVAEGPQCDVTATLS